MRRVPSAPLETSAIDKHAFAFDIDGVLLGGGKPIPQALETMRSLDCRTRRQLMASNPVLVINGDGKTEEQRCLDLSR